MPNSSTPPEVTSTFLPYYNIILHNGYQHAIVADSIAEDDTFIFFHIQDDSVPFAQVRKDKIAWFRLEEPPPNMIVG
jgi:hypothetical protein